MNKKSKIASWAITFLVALASFVFAGTATANQRFLPSGINGVSPSKAATQVLDYAQLNDAYASLLARQTGASRFNRADYRPVGYSTAKADTLNTSLTPGGGIDQSVGAVGTKTLVLVNIVTSQKVAVMVRCGNIRAKRTAPCNCRPVTIRKVGRILVNKTFVKTVTHTCPSGQAVTVTVNGRVYGWIKGSITAKVIGSAKVFLRQQINLKVTARIKVLCGPPPPPPPPAKSIIVTSMTTLNDIPAGMSSGPFTIIVNSSDAGGSLTVDPGKGAVSRCDSNVPAGSVTFSSLPAGNSDQCVIFYAPSDPTKPATMTVTATATLAGAKPSVVPQTFAITYPVRP